MKLRILFCAAALVLSASALAADQGQNPAAAAARKACADDIQSMCSDKQGGQVFACLRQNNDKLGADCKDAMSKLPARRANPAPAPQQ